MKKRTSQLCSIILLICLIMGQTGCTFSGAWSVSVSSPFPTNAPTAEIEPSGTPTPTSAVTAPPVLPAATDTPVPTALPTPEITPTAIPVPTKPFEPTGTATPTPSYTPTAAPTNVPTNIPTSAPIATPTSVPIVTPTSTPKATPTSTPKATPTSTPKATPTSAPKATPTSKPKATPTSAPKATPTSTPTATPTSTPTATPTSKPKATPTNAPTVTPAANVSFSVSKELNKHGYEVGESYFDSVDSVFDDYLELLMKFQGYSFNQYYLFDKADKAISVANKLISYGGIDIITVTETDRYDNCSYYKIAVSSRNSFIYYYAAKSGDTSKLLPEEIATLNKVLELVNNAKAYKTDFEKEVYFHDWLVLNIAYGDPNVSLAERNNGATLNGQTSYEALILGSCVCAGYAITFDLLMNLSGIETVYVTGNARRYHAWNRVKLEGQWYNVDVTWDDPTPDTPGQVIYRYLNVPDSFLLQDHTPDDTSLPPATATKYNYYVMNSTPCATLKEINDYCIAQKELGKKQFYVLYSGEEPFNLQDVIGTIRSALHGGFNYGSLPDTYEFGTVLEITLWE